MVLKKVPGIRGVLWSDLDVVWFQNPFGTLRRVAGDSDAAFSTDVGLGANTGVYYVKVRVPDCLAEGLSATQGTEHARDRQIGSVVLRS